MTEPVSGAGRRRAALRRQRRTRRRRLVVAALTVLVLVAALVTVYLARRQPPVPTGAGGASPSAPAPAPTGLGRVRVFNGVGTPQLADQARDRLVAAGLTYVAGGNAPRFGLATTEVQVGDATPQAVELGTRVAQALGVPATAVGSSVPTPVADVVVVIGADFAPR